MKVIKNISADKVSVVDRETAEVLGEELVTKTDIVVAKDAESFFMVYSSIIGVLANLSGSEVKVLHYICTNAQFNTNMIVINKVVAEDISKKTGIAYQTVRNCTSTLTRKNILISLGSATYRVNPKYYWKGMESQRRQTYKYILEVECPDCE